MTNYVIDLDDTLLLYPEYEYSNIEERYKDAIPDLNEIEIVNRLFTAGNIIIIHTGRNWDKYEITKRQLADFNINYHELVMGKPQGIYIDKDSYKTLHEALNDK